MQRKRSNQYLWAWKLLGIIGLLYLIIKLYKNQSNNPKDVIERVLKNAGVSDKQIKFWTAIASHETNNFTSNVLKQGNNLFGMGLASKNTTAIGTLNNAERSARYNSLEDSVKDILLYQFVRFRYPNEFNTLDDLIDYMKSKGYFSDTIENYKAGVNLRYQNLYA